MGSPSSFANAKDLKFVFTLGSWQKNNLFVSGGSTYNTITIRGLRASANIENAGGAMLGTLNAQIYGVPMSDINKLTSQQWKRALIGAGSTDFSEYTVQVFAIDGTQESLIYNGDVLNCWGDFTGIPDACLNVQAVLGYTALVNPANPLSISADTTVGTAMKKIASEMGFSFQNTSASGTLLNTTVKKGSYFGNTAMEQARSLMDAYHFWMYLDSSTNPPTLAIVPQGDARQQQAVPLITPQTGLQGYPLLSSTGVTFQTLFNPSILLGAELKIGNSSVLPANGTWTAVSISHALSSQMPGGPWFTAVQAVSSKFGQLNELLGAA